MARWRCGEFVFTFLFSLVFVSCQFNAVSSQSQQTPSPAQCSITWLTKPSMSVPNSTYFQSSNDVYTCQAACVSNTSCTGIDFDGANRCWLSLSEAKLQNATNNDVTHYTILRNINSCPANLSCTGSQSLAWVLDQNMHVNGGNYTNDQDFNSCLMTCRDNPACVGFDWDQTVDFPNCWLTKNQNPHQSSAGVLHYDKDCSASGIQIATPMMIPNNAQGSFGVTFRTQPAIVTGFFFGSTQPVAAQVFYDSGSQAISPAYIVLAGLGGGCLLLVIIAIITICNYPLKDKADGGGVMATSELKRRKKTPKETGELHTRVPKSLIGEERTTIDYDRSTVNHRNGPYDTYTSDRNSNLDRYNTAERHMRDSKVIDAPDRVSYDSRANLVNESNYNTAERANTYGSAEPVTDTYGSRDRTSYGGVQRSSYDNNALNVEEPKYGTGSTAARESLTAAAPAALYGGSNYGAGEEVTSFGGGNARTSFGGDNERTSYGGGGNDRPTYDEINERASYGTGARTSYGAHNDQGGDNYEMQETTRFGSGGDQDGAGEENDTNVDQEVQPDEHHDSYYHTNDNDEEYH